MYTHLHSLHPQERPWTEYAAKEKLDLGLEWIRLGTLDPLLVHLVNVVETIFVRKGFLAVEDGQDIRQVDVLVLTVTAYRKLHSHLVWLERVKQSCHLPKVGVLGDGVSNHKGEEIVENGASVTIMKIVVGYSKLVYQVSVGFVILTLRQAMQVPDMRIAR